MAKCKIDVPSNLILSSPFAALEIAAVSPFLSASKTLNSRTLCSVLPPSAGKDTLAAGIISYAGDLTVSVMTDAPDGSEGTARKICERYEQRFAQYVAVARKSVK